jgi:hypothetical protein
LKLLCPDSTTNTNLKPEGEADSSLSIIKIFHNQAFLKLLTTLNPCLMKLHLHSDIFLKKARAAGFASSFIFISCLSGSQALLAQEAPNEKLIDFKVTTDVVSQYIWRGTVASLNPNIQPTFALVAGNIEAGLWGSTDFLASYKELDPYIACTIKSFKISVTDYDWTFGNSSYFNYKNSSTEHIIEVGLNFTGTAKLPLNVSLNTMVFGADKKWDKNTDSFSDKQNFSTYLELSWLFKPCTIFVGMTPNNGYYGAGYGKIDGFAICNLGISSTRNIKITQDFTLPLKGSFYVNPQAESVHMVIGITL